MMRWLLTSILTLLIVISGTIIVFSDSTWGTKQLINTMIKLLPGHCEIGQIQGELSHHLLLRHIVYQDTDHQIALATIIIDWQPQQLLHRQLWINNLQLEQLKVYHWRFAKNQRDQQFKLPFFKRIYINHFAIQAFMIPKTRFKLTAINAIVMNMQGQLDWLVPQQQATGRLALQAGANQLQINVHFKQRWYANWQMAIPKLRDLIPQSQGIIFSQGKVDYQPGHLPIIDTTMHAKNIHFLGYSLQNLVINGQLANEQFNQINIELKNATDQKYRIDQFRLIGKGTLARHQLQWHLVSPLINSDGKLQGDWQSRQWRGQITQAKVDNKKLGQWRLVPPAILIVRSQYLQLQHFRWRHQKENFLLSGIWQKGDYDFNERGSLPIAALGITLNPAILVIKGDSQQCHYQGVVHANKGQLALQGTLQFKPFMMHTTIKGQNFLAVNLPHYQVSITPDLTLTYQQRQWQLMGNLAIPYARIIEPDFSQQSVTLPTEVVFVGQEPRQQSQRSLINHVMATVNVSLGTDTQLQMAGFDANFSGNIQINQTPKKPALATGKIFINHGTYLIYGKKLFIKHGQLLFNQSLLANPALQLRASKTLSILNSANINTINNTTSLLPGLSGAPSGASQLTPNFNYAQKVYIGVDVSGYLQNPILTLYANPPIVTSQADILSYLIFGHAADQLSFADARILLETSSKLKLPSNQVAQLTQELQDTLGLDQFKIGSTSYVDTKTGILNQDTALILGKALSPRSYVTYSRGLSSSLNIFTLSYLLSRHWSLQGSGGTLGNGADLIYTLTRD